MRIGEVARRTGASVRSLRYYEEQGLLEATRTASGQRTYDASVIDRVRLVQQFFAAGLSSRRIVEMLPCVHSGTTTTAQRVMLAREREKLAAQIAELSEVHARLGTMIALAEERREDAAALAGARS